MPEVQLSKTARDKILEPYEIAGEDHEYRTTPITSANQLVGEVVNVYAAGKMAWLKIKPQKVVFFRAGDGDSVPYGPDKVTATDAETNLQKGGSTDGARDMAIEGFGLSSGGTLIKYYEDNDAVTGFGVAPTDDDVVAALKGKARICDPFGLIVPPQIQSPYLLEDALFQEVIRLSTVEITTDSSKPFKMGLADMFPGAAGASHLRSNGNADASNVFRFPEGILWNRDSRQDSDLKVTLELHRPIIIPISTVILPGGQSETAPKRIYQRITARLFGVAVGDLGNN